MRHARKKHRSVWFPPGTWDREAEVLARLQNLAMIKDRCIMEDHRHLFGAEWRAEQPAIRERQACRSADADELSKTIGWLPEVDGSATMTVGRPSPRCGAIQVQAPRRAASCRPTSRVLIRARTTAFELLTLTRSDPVRVDVDGFVSRIQFDPQALWEFEHDTLNCCGLPFADSPLLRRDHEDSFAARQTDPESIISDAADRRVAQVDTPAHQVLVLRSRRFRQRWSPARPRRILMCPLVSRSACAGSRCRRYGCHFAGHQHWSGLDFRLDLGRTDQTRLSLDSRNRQPSRQFPSRARVRRSGRSQQRARARPRASPARDRPNSSRRW